MGDWDLNLNIRASELGIDLERAAESKIKEAQEAVAEVVQAGFAAIVAKVQQKLKSTKDDYLKGLKIDRVGKYAWVISLEGDFANALEEGRGSFDMKPGMLASTKTVDVGKRAGQPWVQKGADNQRFAHVPLDHNPRATQGYPGHLAGIIRNFKAPNAQGVMQKLTATFKDRAGNPLEGQVASVSGHGIKDLENLIKYQHVYTSKTGKKSTSSIYRTYRTVSDNSKDGSWVNKGFAALHAFDEAQRLLETEIDNVLKTILKD